MCKLSISVVSGVKKYILLVGGSFSTCIHPVLSLEVAFEYLSHLHSNTINLLSHLFRKQQIGVQTPSLNNYSFHTSSREPTFSSLLY